MERSDPHGLLLCDDLIFSSKITATARAHGLTVRVARTVESLEAMLDGNPAAVILELDHSPFDIPALVAKVQALTPPPRLVCYGSHVDVERLKLARRAGCEIVLPRSQFVERIESEIAEWLSC